MFQIKYPGGVYKDLKTNQEFVIIEIIEPFTSYKVYYEDDSVLILTDVSLHHEKLENGKFRYTKKFILTIDHGLNWIMYAIQLLLTAFYLLSLGQTIQNVVSFWLVLAVFFSTTYLVVHICRYLNN